MWKTVFRQRIDAFLAGCAREGKVKLIVSPDVDGVVSACLLSKYALESHGLKTEINGTYDCKRIVTVGGDGLEECMWVDLDLPQKNVMCIGQHLCGDIGGYKHTLSFNPNEYFENRETWTKFPFGTAQLFYHGLFEEGVYKVGSAAEALLAHCDSTYFNCQKYKPNCSKWITKMFKGSTFMDRLVNNEYKSTMLAAHTNAIAALEPHVTVKKKWTEQTEGWDRVRSRQTCKALKKAPTEGMGHLVNLFGACGAVLGSTVAFRGTPESAVCIWTGRRKMVPLYSERIRKEGLKKYLEAVEAKSHAIVSTRFLSLTLEE